MDAMNDRILAAVVRAVGRSDLTLLTDDAAAEVRAGIINLRDGRMRRP